MKKYCHLYSIIITTGFAELRLIISAAIIKINTIIITGFAKLRFIISAVIMKINYYYLNLFRKIGNFHLKIHY